MAGYGVIRETNSGVGLKNVALQRARTSQRAVFEKNRSTGLVFSRAISVSPANTTLRPWKKRSVGSNFVILGVNFVL
jgi:hypothetical protein